MSISINELGEYVNKVSGADSSVVTSGKQRNGDVTSVGDFNCAGKIASFCTCSGKESNNAESESDIVVDDNSNSLSFAVQNDTFAKICQNSSCDILHKNDLRIVSSPTTRA